MSRTHDVTISAFDLDRLESELERTKRERDEAIAYADQLAAGLPEGMLPKDVELLREANHGLASELAAERALFKIQEDQLNQVRLRLTNECALSDRLAGDLNDLWHNYTQKESDREAIEAPLAAWKEARSE